MSYLGDKKIASRAFVGGDAEGTQRLHNYGDMNIIPTDASNFTYSISGNTVTITGRKSSTWVVDTLVIPYEIDNRKVVGIGELAFHAFAGKDKLILPKTVQILGDGAFCGAGFAHVILPEGLKTISNSAFSGCLNLTHVEIPHSVETIGPYAFYNTGLTKVTLPQGFQSINDSAFRFLYDYRTGALEQIIIPESVSYIESRVFMGHPNVTIYCRKGSYAETFAKTNNIPYTYYDASDVMDMIPNFRIKKKVISAGGTFTIQPNSIIIVLPPDKCMRLYRKDGSLISSDTYGKLTLYVSDNCDICYAGTTSSLISMPEMYLEQNAGVGCYIKGVNGEGFTVMTTEYSV